MAADQSIKDDEEEQGKHNGCGVNGKTVLLIVIINNNIICCVLSQQKRIRY